MCKQQYVGAEHLSDQFGFIIDIILSTAVGINNKGIDWMRCVWLNKVGRLKLGLSNGLDGYSSAEFD